MRASLPRTTWPALAALALAAGCAAVAPHSEPPTLPLPPVPYATFAFAGTPPVVDAEEEHVVRVGLARDTASLALVRRWLAAGQWPPLGAVRPEDFTAALAVPPLSVPAQVTLAAPVFASSFRPGWEVLALRITTPVASRPAPSRAVEVIVDAHAAGAASDALSAALAVAVHASDPRAAFSSERRELVPALQAALAQEGPGRELVVVSDGAGLGGPDAQRALLTQVAAARPALHVTVVGVLASGYDDAFLRALAQAGGGSYVLDDATPPAARAEALVRGFDRALEAAWLAVDLDPGVVARWRLIGHENLVPQGPERPPGRALEAATTTTVFIEVKRLEDLPRLGHATLYDGTRAVAELELAAAPPAVPELVDAMRLYTAAIVAEKLRGSYWVQHTPWSSLVATTRGTSLAELVQRAAALSAPSASAVPTQHPLPSP